MVAFVLFWSATFAIIFFVLGMIFKALISVISALMDSVATIAIATGITGAVVFALYILYEIVYETNIDGFWSIFLDAIGFVVILAVFGLLFWKFGMIILDIIVSVADYLLGAVLSALEWSAEKCEAIYTKSLQAIIKRLDRC